MRKGLPPLLALLAACVVIRDNSNRTPMPTSSDAAPAVRADAAVVLVDAAPVAATPPDAATATCGPHQRGACPPGQICYSCSQPARSTFFCTTACQANADCKDPARPSCEGGYCGQQGMLHHCRSKCAAPDTPIRTPTGDRPIASLSVGDLVHSVDAGRVVAVPLIAVRRTPVSHHQVVQVTLTSGAVLLISGGHPTADGRVFDDLSPGDRLGDAAVTSIASIRYPYDATYDILPATPTGTYFAAGALVGSTLAPLWTARSQ